MTEFGGVGGLEERRELNSDDRFEMAVERALGDEIRSDVEIAKAMWSALANVDWYHPENHDYASYSFRAAGDLIAAIRADGNYMDWYCCGPYAEVSDHIARALKKEGWISDKLGAICDEPGCLKSVGCGFPTADGGYRTTCGDHYREYWAKHPKPGPQQPAFDDRVGQGDNSPD